MSFYIVENSKQLQALESQDSCFICLIPLNFDYHPKLTTPSLIYYRGQQGKGYTFCIDHSESFSLTLGEINEFLKQHKSVYTLDAKRHLYYFPDISFQDINFNRQVNINDFNTTNHNYYYSKYKFNDKIEKIIPITKQHEKFENLYAKFTQTDFTRHIDSYTTCIKVFSIIEHTGIQFVPDIFYKIFEPAHEMASIKTAVLHQRYNLYNSTTRPTNAFNGINFNAIPKHNRHAFIPSNDIFVEFDYSAFHPQIIAREIKYSFNDKIPVYEQLAKMYGFDSSEESIKIAKEYTFKQLYGGIEDKYKDIEYFKRINEWINDEWSIYKDEGKLTLQGGKIIMDPNLNKNQMFNYIIQSMETFINVETMERILPLLEGKKSKLILYNYDSFLFDISKDEKDTMNKIKEIISESFPVRISYGHNYRDMERIHNF